MEGRQARAVCDEAEGGGGEEAHGIYGMAGEEAGKGNGPGTRDRRGEVEGGGGGLQRGNAKEAAKGGELVPALCEVNALRQILSAHTLRPGITELSGVSVKHSNTIVLTEEAVTVAVLKQDEDQDNNKGAECNAATV